MKLKKVIFALCVGVLSALFIGFLIDAIYESPEYNDYCKRNPEPKQIIMNEKCSFVYNQAYRDKCFADKGMIIEEYDKEGCVAREICDYCERDYQNAMEKYNLNLFYITAPIGLLMILLGLYLPATLDAIAGGTLLGGILTMIQITMRVFGNLGKWPRVILLGVELVIVLWVGVKKVKEGIVFRTKR